MKREEIEHALGDIDDAYITESLPAHMASARYAQPRGAFARFINSGAGAAVISGLVALGVLVAIVVAGQGGTGGDTSKFPPSDDRGDGLLAGGQGGAEDEGSRFPSAGYNPTGGGSGPQFGISTPETEGIVEDVVPNGDTQRPAESTGELGGGYPNYPGGDEECHAAIEQFRNTLRLTLTDAGGSELALLSNNLHLTDVVFYRREESNSVSFNYSEAGVPTEQDALLDYLSNNPVPNLLWNAPDAPRPAVGSESSTSPVEVSDYEVKASFVAYTKDGVEAARSDGYGLEDLHELREAGGGTFIMVVSVKLYDLKMGDYNFKRVILEAPLIMEVHEASFDEITPPMDGPETTVANMSDEYNWGTETPVPEIAPND